MDTTTKDSTRERRKLSFCEASFLEPKQQASRPMFALTQISLSSFESYLCFFLLKKHHPPTKTQTKPMQTKQTNKNHLRLKNKYHREWEDKHLALKVVLFFVNMILFSLTRLHSIDSQAIISSGKTSLLTLKPRELHWHLSAMDRARVPSAEGRLRLSHFSDSCFSCLLVFQNNIFFLHLFQHDKNCFK